MINMALEYKKKKHFLERFICKSFLYGYAYTLR